MITDQIPKVYRSLLIGIYNFFEATDRSNGQFVEGNIGALRKFGVNPGIARAGLQWLVERGLLQSGSDNDQQESWVYWEFTPSGAELVHDLVSKQFEQSVSITTFDSFGAGLFTDLRGTADSVEEVKESLEKIERYVKINNEFDLPSDERVAVATELHSLRLAIEQGLTRTTTLANVLLHNGVFQFLKEKVPDKTIGALISVVVGHIAKWLGL